MRYSCDQGDPGYQNYIAAGRFFRVTLNGRECKDVRTADVGQRKVLRYKRGADGQLLINSARDAIETEWLYGAVRIEPILT